MFEMIISAYRWAFLQMASVLGPGWAIVALSFVCSALMAPLMKAVAGIVRRESDYQSVIDPQVAAIKAKYASDMDRHLHVQRLYSRYGYSPLSPVKKVLPLFVQIPFLLLTYFMLKGTVELNGVAFLFLRDLGQPDALIPIRHANLLPLVMTGVNIVTVFATPSFTKKDWTQAIAIALIFLVLLYNAPSALLLYWTLNNFIVLVRTVVGADCKGGRLLVSRVLLLRHLPKMSSRILSVRVLALMAFVLITLSLYCYVTGRFLVLRPMTDMTTYRCCQRGMLGMISLGAVVTYCLLWRDAVSGLRCVVVAFLALLLTACFGLVMVRFLSQDVYYSVKTYVDRFTVFEVFSFLVIMPLFIRRTKAYAGALSDLICVLKTEWPLFFALLLMAIHYAFSSTNITLSAGSIIVFCVYMVVPVSVLAVLAVTVFRLWIRAEYVFRAVMGLGFGVYLVPLFSTEHGVWGCERNFAIRILVIVVVAALSVLFRNRRMLHVFIALLFLAAIGNGFAVSHQKAAMQPGADDPRKPLSTLFGNAECRRRNNVFFLVYDAYENPIVQRALGIDDPTLEPFLRSNGFVLYDAYSIGYHTLASISSAFAIGGQYGQTQRSTVAGDNPFCDFLKENGYRNSFMLCSYTMPQIGERLPGDFYYPKPSHMVPKEQVLYSCILRGILSQSPTVFNAYTQSEWASVKHELIKTASPVGNFIYAHCGLPDHANYESRYRGTDEQAIREYIPRLREATKAMRADVEATVSRCDDAIIVLASDHGAYLRSPDIVDRPDARDVLDRQGIFLAIRWPADYEPTLQLNCLQNLMPEILICLTGDVSLRRFESEGLTDAMRSPATTPQGLVRRGIIQQGADAGKSLFDAARELFFKKAGLHADLNE